MEPRLNGKLKMLYIVDILKEYSDEDCPVTATEICEHLAEYGVKAERKAIYDDIDQLIYYGYDIVKTRGKRSGYFLASREFDVPSAGKKARKQHLRQLPS